MQEPALEYPTDHAVGEWTDWAAVAGYSGFRVCAVDGRVGLAQIGTGDFAVSTTFAFVDEPTVRVYVRRLEAAGWEPDQAAALMEDARTLVANGESTDLASVPQFMAWFEAPYGRHTLAAILHDHLIRDEPDTGTLGSDILADSFFRDMMGVAGVPFFKRWLMWAAVAARTRWFASFPRRLSLIVWGITALAGITSSALALAGAVADLGAWDRPWLFLLSAVVLPFASGLLWGKQYGASIVAAAAGLWLVPAAVIVALGLTVYRFSEWFACRVMGHDQRIDPGTVLIPDVPEPVGVEAVGAGPVGVEAGGAGPVSGR